MTGGSLKNFDRSVKLHINRAAEEVAACAEHKFRRNEWVFDSAVRARFTYKTTVARRRILAFGETVDFVVEEHYVDVDVAAHGVNEMIAADCKSVAIA